jgi:bacterial leucyl aminopeptidase
MRIMRAALLALATLAGGPSFAASDGEVWITLGREAVPVLQAAVSAMGQPDSFAVVHDREVTVARIRERQIPLLARIMHERFRRCGGFVVHASEEAALREAIRDAEAEAQAEPAPLFDYTIDNGPVVQAMMAQLQEANVRSTITSLGGFFTRYHACPSAQDSANWIKTLWQGYAQGRSDVTVELFNHPPNTTPQPSVILTIPGSTFPTEVVVVGGHQDSIAGTNCNTSRAPGEDDDASGVASFSEVIRVALALDYRPLRTVKFMAYAAEEVGLRGSQDIATQYDNANVNVVGVLQLDMTNYKGTPSADIVLVTDRTNAAQNTFVNQLVDVYLGLPRTTTQCGYGCSDHSSWNARGYAASFPFESVFGQHNPWIHTSGDTIDKSGGHAAQALKFAKLAAAYVAELAKGGVRKPPSTRR